MDDALGILDQTDLSADSTPATPAASSSIFGSTLDDLANSAIATIGGAAVSGLGKTVSGALTPSPDLAAKAATPSAISVVGVGSVALPILLIGGAVIAFMVLKKR